MESVFKEHVMSNTNCSCLRYLCEIPVLVLWAKAWIHHCKRLVFAFIFVCFQV